MLKSIVALALLANAAVAEAAEPPCLTEAEFRSVGLYMLPAVIEATASGCEAHLPADAYLLTQGRRLATSVSRDADAHRQEAMVVMARFIGDKMPEGVSRETFAGLVTDMVRNGLIKSVKPADCVTIDEAATLLAPLPAENLIGLVGLFARAGMKGDKKPPFRFCDARRI